jgi:hypothetical protein
MDSNTATPTVELLVQMDLHDKEATPNKARKLSMAVYRAIEYTMDNDIEGTAPLCRARVGQVTVKPLSTTTIKSPTQALADGYEALHGGLSDMIESGRLCEVDIPDDYHWLVDSLEGLCKLAVPVDEAKPLPKRTDNHLDDRELATVLAALRYWQREGQRSSGYEHHIANRGDTLRPLNNVEIDALCERINQ